mmetsp:Transcript_37928/g.43307  ORF Transcript_37928/g.43307 Transcript_37928/m.43307 type:complete len:215 (+) Transcript_37928:106-750(+)
MALAQPKGRHGNLFCLGGTRDARGQRRRQALLWTGRHGYYSQGTHRSMGRPHADAQDMGRQLPRCHRGGPVAADSGSGRRIPHLCAPPVDHEQHGLRSCVRVGFRFHRLQYLLRHWTDQRRRLDFPASIDRCGDPPGAKNLFSDARGHPVRPRCFHGNLPAVRGRRLGDASLGIYRIHRCHRARQEALHDGSVKRPQQQQRKKSTLLGHIIDGC